jgi:hypothetical protein
VFDLVEGGLTLRPFGELKDELRNKVTDICAHHEYDAIRGLCIGFTGKVLRKVSSAGELQDAFIYGGGMGGPEELSFMANYDFYLRPANVINFLCGNRTEGGAPMELYFRYQLPAEDGSPQIFQKIGLRYNPTEKVMTIREGGFYQREGNRLKLMDSRPDVESPLVRLIESYRGE